MGIVKLTEGFYTREDVVLVARELLGKYLLTQFDGGITGGMIVETEAYEGVTDRASHAWNNRRTARTEVMFGRGGLAYVYLCYGVHSLFNIVTNRQDTPHAVLVRGIVPEIGLDIMQRRTGKPVLKDRSGIGPGKVSTLLGIHYSHSGISLTGAEIWLEDRGVRVAPEEILAGPRVGVDYAGEDAGRPYRFRMTTKRQVP